MKPTSAAAVCCLLGVILSGCAGVREKNREIAMAHYRLGEAHLQKGRGLDDEMNRREAYPEFLRAIEKDPGNPLFYIALGNIHLYNQQYLLAQENYKKVLEMEPNNSMAHQNLGQLYLIQEKYAEAIAEFDQSLGDMSYQTPAVAHFNKGRAQFKMNDFERAAVSFRAALDIAPSVEGAWYFLGLSLEKLNRLAEAERSFRRALDLLPNSAPSHYWLGLVLFKQKKNQEAAAEFKLVVELDKDGELGRNAAKYLSVLK